MQEAFRFWVPEDRRQHFIMNRNTPLEISQDSNFLALAEEKLRAFHQFMYEGVPRCTPKKSPLKS